jgi:hypothetical protein
MQYTVRRVSDVLDRKPLYAVVDNDGTMVLGGLFEFRQRADAMVRRLVRQWRTASIIEALDEYRIHKQLIRRNRSESERSAFDPTTNV